MRQRNATRLLSGAALTVFLALASGPAAYAQAESGAGGDKPAESFAPEGISTFSGAFLAARTADVDKDYKNAIAFYRKALEFDPHNLEIRQRLMISLLMAGEFEEGVKYANDLQNDPSVERITSIVRGLDAINKGDYAGAEKILIYNGPNDLERMMNSLLVAWARMGAGKSDEALSMIRKLRGPQWFAIFKNYHAGALAAATGNVSAARNHLNEAILDRDGSSTAPDTFIRAVMALARLEAQQGNKQKALDTIAVGENFINNYAPLKALRESISRGEKPAQQISTAAQGASAVLFSVGSALNRQGADDAVMLYLQAAYALDPQSADTLVLLGGIAENTDQIDKAIEFYRRVPQDSPMRRISELQLGVALAQTGKTDEARKHLKSLIEADPNDIRSYLAYGGVLSDAKDYEEMAKTFDQAVGVIGPVANRNQWPVFFQRGIAYERLKKWDQAEPNFRKALELNPDQPQVLNYLGYSWVDMNRNLDEGLEMIRRAVELRPDDGYIVDSLGWAYYRLNRYDEAVDELERAADLKAGDPTINDHLGDAYWRVGRKVEAVYQWQRALTMKPELPEIPKIEAKIKDGLPAAPKQLANGGASSDGGKAAPTTDGDKPATDPAVTKEPQGDPAIEMPSRQMPPAPDTKAELVPAQHTILPGESLWTIAEDMLGDGQRFTDILNANPRLKRNPNRLFPGQTIELPRQN
ncbi:tetratricopeptide repeat protein [Rhizobiaceae bacterium n13]|uniref:Tetratricopeptide repeat protein n=1 Tax=Ferirhizobium litorale TaxID=2927786 RepID=A0AAE3QEF6_9HYPH|nr:tetratricopeptide repeat protein [Fererhizobium litorale]MDI7861502.1 tetratricopeptide repeat protein [Fererhizobium litorale]MDI7921648.1 tetratricopeptide repeat protein [Fererhizobium litorale]